jgi:hypothetical protein
MTSPDLGLVEKIQCLGVPALVECGARAFDEADTEEAVCRLDGRGHDADVREHAAEQNAPDAPPPELPLEISGSEGPEGPLVHDDLAGQRSTLIAQLVAWVADQIVADRRAVAVRPRVRDGQPGGAGCLQ